MVTTRKTGGRVQELRTTWKNYLTDFGTTVTLRHNSTTLDSMKRVTALSAATSTIKADIQWSTKSNVDHLNMGEIKIGSGDIFTLYDADIALQDEFTFNNVRYRITSQIEGEVVEGDVIYLGFAFEKNAQT